MMDQITMQPRDNMALLLQTKQKNNKQSARGADFSRVSIVYRINI